MSEIRKLNRLSNKPYVSIKDPVSCLTHFLGFVAFIFLTPVLLLKGSIDQVPVSVMIGLSIYCLSLIQLYGASSAYHAFVLPQPAAGRLKKLDHMSVFLLIAGSYTPICLSVPDQAIRVEMLALVWLFALAGIIMKAFWVYCPRYVSSIIYIAMGWLAVIHITTFYQILGPQGFFLLLSGGIIYTLGGILYAFHIRISPDWSEHEIFHLFVLLGSLLHYLMMFIYIA